jgi:Uma2 family endonuclease
MTLLQAPTILDSWQPASWEDFIKIADDPSSAKLKGYYYQGNMRFEPISTGSDHSQDHTIIILGVGLFASLQGIAINGHDGCSYRKRRFDEFQPDISYYIGEAVEVIPWGTRVIDLDQYPLPNLVIEISDASLKDDLGAKRLQYEDLGIAEYWIVNVQTRQIVAFTIAPDGGIHRVRESHVLPGLHLEILEQALQFSCQENQSVTTAWLIKQFSA